MPHVVRNLGDLKHARNVDGQMVYRQDEIFLQSYGYPVRCLNTDNHFVFKSHRLGAGTVCTCGSPAVTLGYHAYYKYSSYIGNEVLCCHYFFETGRHADGSS